MRRRLIVGGVVSLALIGFGIFAYAMRPDRADHRSTMVISGGTYRIGTPQPGSGVSRDPALTAAAQRIGPILESAFPDSYTGLAEDQANRRLIIFRRPDPELDRRVGGELPGTTVLFVDARYSKARLNVFAHRVLGDADYWRGRGVTIMAVVDKMGGSGVDVLVAAGAGPDTERLMNEHYGDVPITVHVT